MLGAPRRRGAPSARGRHAQREHGLAPGRYSLLNGATCVGCAHRIWHQCRYRIWDHSVPSELLVPGRLGDRRNLSELSLCFLWYARSFWMRGTGGGDGLMHFRFGGVDDKAALARMVSAYEQHNGCRPWQIAPATVNLSDATSCLEFYLNNSKWDARRPGGRDLAAADSARLWFVKDALGSQGTHISLLSGQTVAAAAAAEREAVASLAADTARAPLCPRPGLVASLNVEDLWLLDGRKFDNRFEPVRLSGWLSVCLSICLSICLSASVSAYLSACVHTYLQCTPACTCGVCTVPRAY